MKNTETQDDDNLSWWERAPVVSYKLSILKEIISKPLVKILGGIWVSGFYTDWPTVTDISEGAGGR